MQSKNLGEGKVSRIDTKPAPEGLNTLITTEIHLHAEIAKLKSELSKLTEINTRLRKEITYYHTKFGITVPERIYADTDGRDITVLPSLLHEFDFLQPLFTAYDYKINALEGALNNASSQIFELEKKAQTLVEDNNVLRAQLEKKSQQLLDIYRGGKSEENLITGFFNLEKEDMNERMRLLNEENHTLLVNLKELNQNFQNLQKRYNEKIEESESTFSRYSELSKKNKQLELDLEDTKKMRDVLEVKFKNATEDLNRADLEREELINKCNKLENELKIAKSQLNNSKKSFTELEEKKQMEIEILTKELEGYRVKERELANKLIFNERDLDQLKEDNRKLKKELENTKADCDQMLKMMENFEAKIQHYQRKEEQINKLAKESKEKVEEALLQRDRALLKEEQYQKTIESMTETHRQEVQAIKEQYDRMMDNLRNKHKVTLEGREAEIKSLNDELTKLHLQFDKISKENKTLRSEVSKLNSVLKDQNTRDEEKLAEAEKKNQELEEKLIKIEHEYSEKVRNLTREVETLTAATRDYANTITEMKTTVEATRSQNATLATENSTLKSKLSSIQKERQNFLEEIDKIKKNYELQISIYAEDYNAKMKEMEDQVQESIQKEKITREKTLDLLKTHEKIEEKLKKELENNIRHYEKIIADLKNENKYLSQNKLLESRTEDPKEIKYTLSVKGKRNM